jgi:hypothetical protein
MEGLTRETAAGSARLVVRPGDPSDELIAFFDAAFDVVHPYLARRGVGDAKVADDPTQETFVTAIRSLRSGSVEHAGDAACVGEFRRNCEHVEVIVSGVHRNRLWRGAGSLCAEPVPVAGLIRVASLSIG